MKTESKTYRLSGLIAVIGLLTLLVGLILMILLPSIRYAAWLVLLLGVLLLAAAFIIDFKHVGRALSGRRGKFGAGTMVMVSVFVGITILVNAISVGSYHRFDFTGVAQFTLTPQTKEILGKLERPVQVLCFFVPNDPYGIGSYATNLLNEYQNYTNQLSVDYIDPDEHPEQAREYNISEYQTVVFETEKGHRSISPTDIVVFSEEGEPIAIEAENAFISAILEVTGIVQKKIYFLTGHGETDIYSEYNNARESLLDNLFKVDVLDLTKNPNIPDDCATLIIAGPQGDIVLEELGIISRYLESGGRVLFMVNPNPSQGVKQFLSSWGVEIKDGTIIDPSSYVTPSIDSPSVPETRNTLALSAIYFPGATAIIPHAEYRPTIALTEEGEMSSQIVWISDDSEIQMIRIIWTSVDSWLETKFDPLEEPEFNEETELKGPLALSFFIVTPPSSEVEEERGAALLVIGDSDFASNQHFYNGDNGNLFLSSVERLTAGEEIVSIERKVLPFRRLLVDQQTANFINISSIGLLPLLLLVVGSFIWWRRR